ncbi:MAG: ABC transporter permease [Clostridiales bacterium]|nr:ABC transporter permease [Clostridiales bacterium]
MKNPLTIRLFRELRKDWKKYFVLFLLMVFMIALASGYIVGNDSMMAAIDETYEKYSIEDGHFDLKKKPTQTLLDAMPEDIRLYEQFYKDLTEKKTDGAEASEEKDVTVRVFKIRTEVNKACLMKGEFPKETNEIAIDQNHANANKIKVGDTIYLSGTPLQVSGLIASSDYSTLYKKNSDFMFNAVDFDIAIMTEEGWEALPATIIYQYAFQYVTPPADVSAQKALSDKLMERLAVLAATGGYTDNKDEAEKLKDDPQAMMLLADRLDSLNELVDYVPEYANQALHFAPEDMGGDKTMVSILVYVFIAVLAFIFAITTSNTITSEAAVIGTLRATGYTRGEILRHYLLLPVIVTILASIAGNALGYTLFKDVAVALYYQSYSLTTYKTLWNIDAFLITTFMPTILMAVVNFFVIYRKLRLSPLRFLRRDLSTSKRKKARRLPSWSFLKRFRLRILMDNAGGYIVLFCGIAFVMLLLAFSIGLPETIDHYKASMDENLLCNYQYILKGYQDEEGNVIETSEESAEKYSVTSLQTVDGAHKGEEISVYGYSEGSRYMKITEALAGNEVWISSPYSKKFNLKKGDTFTLKEKYEDKSYEFVIKRIYDYDGALCVFMPRDNFNKIFQHDEGAFTGYLSSQAISDIDYENIYTVVTLEDVMSIATQLDHSMGDMMDMIAYVCLIMAVLMMYLLTKIIIEKNSTSISMVKVLGYENGEINSLYVLLTSLVVVVSAILTAALAIFGLAIVFRLYMNNMNGWFDIYISPFGIVKMIMILVVSYAIVAFFDMKRIKNIPLADALKNVE